MTAANTFFLRYEASKYDSQSGAHDITGTETDDRVTGTWLNDRVHANLVLWNPLGSGYILKLAGMETGDTEHVGTDSLTSEYSRYAFASPVLNFYKDAVSTFQGGVDRTSEVVKHDSTSSLDASVKVYGVGSLTTSTALVRRAWQGAMQPSSALWHANKWGSNRTGIGNHVVQGYGNANCQLFTLNAGEVFGAYWTNVMGAIPRDVIVRFKVGSSAFSWFYSAAPAARDAFNIVNASGSAVTVTITDVEFVHRRQWEHAGGTINYAGYRWRHQWFRIDAVDSSHAQAELTPVIIDSSQDSWATTGLKAYVTCPVTPRDYVENKRNLAYIYGPYEYVPGHRNFSGTAPATAPAGLPMTQGHAWMSTKDGQLPAEQYVIYPGSGIALSAASSKNQLYSAANYLLKLLVIADPDAGGGGGGTGPMVRTFA